MNHPYRPGGRKNGESMGWKQRIAAYTMSLVCISLLVRPAGAAGIKRYTDSQGVIHITNPGGTDQGKKTPARDNPVPVPRPILQGPENKLIKMRALGILPPEENPAESPEPPESEVKTTPAHEGNR